MKMYSSLCKELDLPACNNLLSVYSIDYFHLAVTFHHTGMFHHTFVSNLHYYSHLFKLLV